MSVSEKQSPRRPSLGRRYPLLHRPSSWFLLSPILVLSSDLLPRPPMSTSRNLRPPSEQLPLR